MQVQGKTLLTVTAFIQKYRSTEEISTSSQFSVRSLAIRHSRSLSKEDVLQEHKMEDSKNLSRLGYFIVKYKDLL